MLGGPPKQIIFDHAARLAPERSARTKAAQHICNEDLSGDGH